jgi:hypothetical protein
LGVLVEWNAVEGKRRSLEDPISLWNLLMKVSFGDKLEDAYLTA